MNKDFDNHPAIRTELPGPKARALLARDAEVVSPSYPREHPFVMSHGRGVEVWDVDGNRFLDFAAGIAVCSTGHSHPQVIQAIKDAADEFLHISPDFSHEKQIALGEKINALSPMGEPVLSFFCQSGTEAVEGALKLARYVSGRSRFIGFLGGFHGRTMGSLAFTASKCTQQQGFSTMPGVTHVPFPNPYRPLFAGDDQGQAVLNYIENILFGSNVPASEVAAILVEREYAANAEKVGTHFMTRLRELQSRHPIIGEVRGKGLMIGMELVSDRASRAPCTESCHAVITGAFHRGLLLLPCGQSTVRFIPPLTVSVAQVDDAITLLEATLLEALAR